MAPKYSISTYYKMSINNDAMDGNLHLEDTHRAIDWDGDDLKVLVKIVRSIQSDNCKSNLVSIFPEHYFFLHNRDTGKFIMYNLHVYNVPRSNNKIDIHLACMDNGDRLEYRMAG